MLIQGDAQAVPLGDQTVQCVITSPPYFGLRDYGIAGQLGLEPTPDAYVANLVAVFREVHRVLKADGVLWLVLGDSYATGAGSGRAMGGKVFGKQNPVVDAASYPTCQPNRMPLPGLKPKDLIGIPWRVAFALQADGWWLRSDIIWAKGYSFHSTTAGSCMPESIKDRPTRSHEYIFLLTKSAKYFYDHEAVKEQGIWAAGTRAAKGSGTREGNRRGTRKKDVEGDRVGSSTRTQRGGFQDRWDATHQPKHTRESEAGHRDHEGGGLSIGTGTTDDGYATYSGTRNLRSVWTINPKPYREAHFATFPPKLVEPMIRAGSRVGDLVLDPFCGSGTVGLVAARHGRRFVGLDLNPTYLALAYQRLVGLPPCPA